MANDISRRNSEFQAPTPQLGTHFLNTRVPWKQCQNRGAPEKRLTKASIMPLIFFLFLGIFLPPETRRQGKRGRRTRKIKRTLRGAGKYCPRVFASVENREPVRGVP
jgi:hypothetical protein